jgi:hypothetical protein
VADLSGLLADLPGEQPGDQAGPVLAGPGLRRYQHRLLKLQLERERLLRRRERHELRREHRKALIPPLVWARALRGVPAHRVPGDARDHALDSGVLRARRDRLAADAPNL